MTRAAVVMPCLNEEAILAETCRSLGFGIGATENEAVLILVDNASGDGTREIMKEIEKQSPSGSVLLCYEPARGYVPPRQCGARAAQIFAKRTGITDADFLVIQADC